MTGMDAPAVVALAELGERALHELFAPYGLDCVVCAPGEKIPGSFWGDSEAGLVGSRLYVRADTPVHSALHEGCHFICMDQARREQLERDAGGDFDEENAVCYLQILLGGALPEVGSLRMCQDMDAWGYTFRLGSARAWFEQDAADARQWLLDHDLIDARGRPTGRVRR